MLRVDKTNRSIPARWITYPTPYLPTPNPNHVVRGLLEREVLVDVNAGDDKQRTALHFAAVAGHGAIVRLLLEVGAHVDPRDTNQNTPLHLAVIANKFAVVVALLEAGACCLWWS